jgi:hypothetical protein
MATSCRVLHTWPRAAVCAAPAEEEQQLKELQLDYSERVAVVEGLKIELRQLKHGACV